MCGLELLDDLRFFHMNTCTKSHTYRKPVLNLLFRVLKGPAQLTHDILQGSEVLSAGLRRVLAPVFLLVSTFSSNCHLPEPVVRTAIITSEFHHVSAVQCILKGLWTQTVAKFCL